MRTRVKICGITRVEDGLAAAHFGADAIGLVFYAPSPRHVTVEQARVISRALPPFVTRVGLFVDATADEVYATIEAVGLEVLQFHGNEPAESCDAFARPYIKAVRMVAGVDLHAQQSNYPGAAALLLDAHVEHAPGGSGELFDWGRVPRDLEKPVILAGGLTPANVHDAIMQIRPFAVDVSSGVEKAPGIKDESKISEFMCAVRAGQQ